MNTSDAKAWCVYITYSSLVGYLVAETFFKDNLSTILHESITNSMPKIAALTAGAWITLAIINKAFEEDKKKKLEARKDNIYSEVINNISYIPLFARLSIPCGLTKGNNEIIKNFEDTISDKTNNYKNEGMDAVDAIRQFIDLLVVVEPLVNRAFKEASKDDQDRYREKIILAYNEISIKFKYDIFRTVLIPIVLDFAESRDVVYALVSLETSFKKYEKIIRSPDLSTENIFTPLIDLLDEVANIYTTIVKDLKKDI